MHEVAALHPVGLACMLNGQYRSPSHGSLCNHGLLVYHALSSHPPFLSRSIRSIAKRETLLFMKLFLHHLFYVGIAVHTLVPAFQHARVGLPCEVTDRRRHVRVHAHSNTAPSAFSRSAVCHPLSRNSYSYMHIYRHSAWNLLEYHATFPFRKIHARSNVRYIVLRCSVVCVIQSLSFLFISSVSSFQ